MLNKKVFSVIAMVCGLSASAMAVNDVGISMPNEFITYKAKNGSAQMQLQAWCIYFVQDIFDPKAIRKAKASGIATFYLSSDTNISPDDRVVAVKKAKMKAFMVKPLKIKVKLGPEDKGKYLIAVIDSPEDQYFSNNQDNQFIPLSAY